MNKQLLIILLFSLGLSNVAMGADKKQTEKKQPEKKFSNALYERLHAGGSRRTPSPLSTKNKEKRTTPSPLATPKAKNGSRTPTPPQLVIYKGKKGQPSSPQNRPTGSPQKLSLHTPPRSHSATPPVGLQTKKVADGLKLVRITEPTEQSTQVLPQIAAPRPYKPERRLDPKSDDHSAGALSPLPAVQKKQQSTFTKKDVLLERLPRVQVQEGQPTSSYFGTRTTALPAIEKERSTSILASSSETVYSEPANAGISMEDMKEDEEEEKLITSMFAHLSSKPKSAGTFTTMEDIKEDEEESEELAQAFTRTSVYRTPKQKILDKHNEEWEKMPLHNPNKTERIHFAYNLTNVKNYDLSDEEREEKNNAYRQPITPLDFRFNAEDIALKALQAEGYM